MAGQTTYVKNGQTYVFAGWYDNAGFVGDPYVFAGKTMPAGDLMLYAKWVPATYTVYYHANRSQNSDVIHTEIVAPYGTAPNIGPYPATPPAGQTMDDWVGWYWYSDGKFVPYHFGEVLLDTHIYPVWNPATLSVTYDLAGGTGHVTDANRYIPGTSAFVLSAGGVTPPTAGNVFLGWRSSADGRLYYPGDSVEMLDHVILTAQWGPVPQDTSIIYDPNGGTGDPYTIPQPNNSTHTVLALGATGISRPGYTFLGWNTYANGSGQPYAPGENVLVDNSTLTGNVLYAQWEPHISVTATKTWDFPAPDIPRPDIWFTLNRINADTTETVIGTQPVPDAATGGAVTWDNQLQTDGNGYTYQYYVKETKADGSDYTPPSFKKHENGLTVENEYEYIDFTATKVWAGDVLPAVKPTVQLQLQVSTDNGPFEDIPGKLIALTDGYTSYTWYNLPTEDSDGRALRYRAVEPVAPESYTAAHEHAETASEITNTYQTTSYAVTKYWEDPNNMMAPGDAWPAIELQLYQDGVAYGDSVQVEEQAQAEDTYDHSWSGLPALKSDGTPHVYTVRELVVPRNYVMMASDTAEKSTITNSLRSDSLTGTKRWAGERPPAGASVTLQLYQTILPPAYPDYREPWGDPVTITAADNWQHTWTGMPVQGTHNGQDVAYEYEIAEVSPPTGYYLDATSSASLYVTNVSQTISFTATKQWVGGINNRPDVVTLYLERSADGGSTWQPVTDSAYELTATDNNQHTWTGLDHYQTWHDTDPSQRVQYIYRVQEEEVANYTTTYPDNNTVKNEYVIPLREITVAKVWDGGPDGDHILPTIRLWRRFMDDHVEEVTNPAEYTLDIFPDPAEEPTSPTFTLTFKNLHSTDGDGNPLLYGFTEDEVQGYTTTFDDPYLLGGVWYALPDSNIINTYDVPMTARLTATKHWVGGPNADHVRVRLTPWRTISDVATTPPNEIVMEPVTWFLATVTPPDGTSETFTGYWPGLAATDNDGNPYTYFFTEDLEHNAEKLQNYTRSYTDFITINGVDYARNGSTVRNSYVPPMTGTATATKTWVNGSTADHEPVTLTLYRSTDGTTMEPVPDAPAPTTSDLGSTITYSWSGLQRTDINGTPYQFFFTEDPAGLPAGYALSYSISTTGDHMGYAPSGATAYNTYTSPTIDVTADKTWINGPMADHVPVTLMLYRMIDGGTLQPVTATYTVSPPAVNGNNTGYTYTWTGVDKTDINGNAYTYCFKEDAVEGYERTYLNPYQTDYGLSGTAVTNTYVQPTGPVSGEKVWLFGNQSQRSDVYMKLYRSNSSTGTEMEEVPDTLPILINSDTPAAYDPDFPNRYTSVFGWDDLQLKNQTGETYYFFVREVDANGDEYTPLHYTKLEQGTRVVNIYHATGSFTPQVTKTVVGRGLAEGEFLFELYTLYEDESGTTQEHIIETDVPNAADGTATFESLPFTAADVGFTYDLFIREKVPADPDEGMTYDEKELKITVAVTDNGTNDGILNLAVAYPDGSTFTNNYAATGELSSGVWATKALSGRTLQGNEFSFVLKDANGTILQEQQNDANGNITFDAIPYDQDDIGKTYTYTITEVVPDPSESGMTYDPKELTFTVLVEDAGDGNLTVTPEFPADAVFRNTFVPDPRIEIVKSADKTSFSAVDEEITYTVTVTNTGNITLTGVNFSDSLSGISTFVKTESNEPADNILQVGEVWTYTYTYKVTQADLDAGKVDNAASVTTTEITDPVEDDHTVDGDQNPGMTVVKEADVDTFDAVGDEITYTVTVTNTGNVSLTNVAVDDSLVDMDAVVPAGDTDADGALDVGEVWVYTYVHTITQDDLYAGWVYNAVSVTATEITNPVEDDHIIPEPSMTVEKSADMGTFSAVGDVITYTVVVTNTGNVPLTDVEITDTLVDLNAVIVTFMGDVNINGELDVGETWTYTYNYVVKQSDLNAGRVPNTVSVLCKGLSDPLTDKVTIPAERLPDRMDDPASGITTINVGDCYE